MKNKSLLFAAVLLAFVSCSEDDDTQYVVSPELETYVNTFISEAQERGVTIPQNNLIARLTTFEAQAVANGTWKGDQKYLFVHEGIFKYSTETGKTKMVEVCIFNALGELFVKNNVPTDLMTVETNYDREVFFNQLMSN